MDRRRGSATTGARDLALVMLVAFAFLYLPLLRQPFIRDDIDIQWILASGKGRALGDVLTELLRRCLLPQYFRPLAAPIFFVMYHVFGLAAAPLRLVTLLSILLTANRISRLAKLLTGNEAVGWCSGIIYAFAWLHWDTAAMTTNLPHALAHLLFWQSLALLAERKTLIVLLLVTIALGLKEDVIVFPAFALLLSLGLPDLRARLRRNSLIFTSWAAAYLVIRLANPALFLNKGGLRPHPAELLGFDGYLLAYKLQVMSWLYLPTAITRARLVRFFLDEPLAAAAWLAAAAALGAGLGIMVSRASRARASVRNERLLILLGLLGSLVAVTPYIAFSRVEYWNCHHLDLSWAALSLPLGLLAYECSRRLAEMGRAGRYGHVVVGVALVVRTAAFFWFPDYRLPQFSRLFSLYHTGQVITRVHRELRRQQALDDPIVFFGFDPAERIPVFLQTLEGRALNARSLDNGAVAPNDPAWWVERVHAGSDVMLTIDAPGRRLVRRESWPFEPSL